jgi:hypothetical protein
MFEPFFWPLEVQVKLRTENEIARIRRAENSFVEIAENEK